MQPMSYTSLHYESALVLTINLGKKTTNEVSERLTLLFMLLTLKNVKIITELLFFLQKYETNIYIYSQVTEIRSIFRPASIFFCRHMLHWGWLRTRRSIFFVETCSLVTVNCRKALKCIRCMHPCSYYSVYLFLSSTLS